jgi:enolase
MVFIVVRHGESLWNKENKFTGWVDIDLSENGITEAIDVGVLLKNQYFDYIITSDLLRAKNTAELIFVNLDIDVEYKKHTQFLETKAIRERNYGELAGVNKTELATKYGEKQMRLWRRSYFERPPGGENLEDVRIRIGEYYDNTILPLLIENKNVLMVAHGNSIRALFVHLGIRTEENIDNFEVENATPICINYNNSSYSYINDFELVGSQIIDSRGFPTIEVACFNKHTKKMIGKGSSPSGASCGSNEVLELRDKNPSFYKGKSVFKALETMSILNKMINLNKTSVLDLKKIDNQLINIDGTSMKTMLGGNTTTAVSFCIADTASKLLNLELFEYISKTYKLNTCFNIPTPFVNIINGGKHGVTDDLKIQEFMIFPNESYSVSKKMQIICEVYQTLQEILVKRYGKQAKSIGDEGGFCPPIYNTEVALNTIEEAIESAKYIVGVDVFMALDCAASEFYNEETKLYEIEKNKYVTSVELIDYYGDLIEKHPALKSIEDGFHEMDYDAWSLFTAKFSDKIMIVGDDLFTTNKNLIKRGLEEKWANSLLLKVNQIGTISEAIESASLFIGLDLTNDSYKNSNVIVSHRSGETNHAYIIDIAVGIGAKYVKIGSPCRGERTAKFNRLIEIDKILNY